MSVNRNQLQILIRDLGAIPPSVRKTLRPAILKAGRPVLDRMRANASWSTRIPAAITMQASTTSPGIRFRVDSKAAPNARPIEHDGQPGTFRHPVYGNREVWRDQPARPFFYRAVEAYADQITDRLGEAVMDAAREHGF